MDPNTLAIPIAFILLAAVLCLLLIGSKWKWWQKLALILIVPAFGLVVWGAIASYKGWPTTDELPEKSLVFQVLIREPDPAHGDPGAIYVWLMPLDDSGPSRINPLDYSSPGGEPRAYKLPYTRSMHQGMERAKGMLQQGKPVVLDRRKGGTGSGQEGQGEPGEPGEPGAEGDGAEGAGGPRGYGYEPGREDFRIYELPPPHPPDKGHE